MGTYFISGRVQPLNEVTIPPIRRIDPKEMRASAFNDNNGQTKTNTVDSLSTNILTYTSDINIQNDLQVGKINALRLNKRGLNPASFLYLSKLR